MADKPRNGGTWSDARYWKTVRSTLRRGFRWWKPIMDCKLAARRPSQSKNKRLKWESQCAICKKWFPEKETQRDHIVPCGPLNCEEDLLTFLRNLTTEDGYQNLCKPCHQIKTNKERKCKNL